MKDALAILTAASIIVFVSQPAAQAEGIDCSKAASPVEKLICTNAEIKAQDETMAQIYSVAAVSMFGSGTSGEVAAQREWLTERDKCLSSKPAEQAQCVSDRYKERNLELAYAAMPAAPALAVKVLRDQKVETADAYEALTIFALEPDGTDWKDARLQDQRQRIVNLIAPSLPSDPPADNPDKPDQRFANDLFSDSGITTPTDALKSSHDFANFLRAATYGSEAVLPCGYILTHPGLLDATNSYFGATPDNFIINTNCRTASPPLPEFASLLDKIDKGWPQCDGTIRFAIYRGFDVTVDTALAPTLRQILDWKPAKRSPDAYQPHKLIGVGKADLQAAEKELAAAYVQYLKAPADKAAHFAKARIEDVAADAQQCD